MSDYIYQFGIRVYDRKIKRLNSGTLTSAGKSDLARIKYNLNRLTSIKNNKEKIKKVLPKASLKTK